MSLGVDASSSCVAACVVDEKREILFVGHVMTDQEDELDRAAAVRELFSSIQRTPDVIVLEQAALMYGMSTSANTLARLQRANAVANLLAWQTFALRPRLVAPATSRKWLGKLNKGTGTVKDAVFLEATSRHMPGYGVTYKRGGKTVKSHHLDEVDAFVLAVHGLTLL